MTTIAKEPSAVLQDLFDQMAGFIRQTPTPVTTEQRLRLYGLYKRVTVGTVCDDKVSAVPPSRLQVQAYAKYQAWEACSVLTREAALGEYVQLAASLDGTCRALLDTPSDAAPVATMKRTPSSGTPETPTDNKEEEGKTSKQNDSQGSPVHSGTATTIESSAACQKNKSSWIRTWLGVDRIEPRGQLDISYADLWFAAKTCLTVSLGGSRMSLQQRWNHQEAICRQWEQSTGRDAVVGLSARSLLDVYLLFKQYPKGSEIILAPGINVPGMLHVMRHHQLKIVSIDIPPVSQHKAPVVVGVDIQAVQNAITSQTVAILVTHVFGIPAASPNNMKRLAQLCRHHNVDLLEDCAESYSGGRPTPSIHADLTLYSFGFIKTSTALAGGVAVARQAEVIAAMQRTQRMVYTNHQSTMEYMCLVATALVVKFLCDSPYLYGIFYFCIQNLGWDFDTVVLRLIRGFPTTRGHCSMTDASSMARIRRKTSVPLLVMLHRRFQGNLGHDCSPSVQRRIQQCDAFASQLSPPMLVEAPPGTHKTHWIFPVRAQKPQLLCEIARQQYGWDMTRGTSQLVCTGRPEESPRASSLMKEIVYLPIASRTLTHTKLRELKAIIDTPVRPRTSQKTKTRREIGLRDVSLVVLFLSFSLYWNLSSLLRTVGFALQGYIVLWLIFLSGCIYLRRSVSSNYLKDSNLFVKYSNLVARYGHHNNLCDDDNRQEHSDGSILSAMEVLQVPSGIPATGTKIILTGSTGFVGGAVLRDLLYHRAKLGVSRVILVCRPKRGISPQQRIRTLFSNPMFSWLSEEEQINVVEVIHGDVTMEDAGINSARIEQIRRDPSISHLIHCAAAVSFTQSIEDAARANISSALFMQKLATSIADSGAKFVHVSTAFVHGGETGTSDAPLGESLYSLGRFDAMKIYQSMIGNQFYAATAIRELGFPNTYAFSKCVCEHLLVARSAAEMVIIRPSIVGPSLSVPHEGWAGSKPSTLVAGACLYFLYQWNLWLFAAHHVPCIPVDVLSRFIIRRSFENSKHSSCSPQSDGNSSGDDDFENVPASEVVSISSSSVTSTNQPTPSLQTGLASSGRSTEIWNAAWDCGSCPQTQFTWMDYALSVFQLGSVQGDFSRPVAFAGLFLLKQLSRLKLTIRQYENLHSLLVVHPFHLFVQIYDFVGRDTRDMKCLGSFLNLPKLFFHFMVQDFYFKSSLVAPNEMRGDRYLFSCTVAAHEFATQQGPSRRGDDRAPVSLPRYKIAGRLHRPTVTDLTWALTQPIGSFAIRVFAWTIKKTVRLVYDEVTVDVESFAALTKEAPDSKIIIAPTHRSFADFILVSFLFFSVPEIQISVPFVAAALEFSQIPVISWLMQLGQAFFVRRNRGRVDPDLGDTVRTILQRSSEPAIEVYIEGTRSRDRRFLPPKTGLLKCVSEQNKGSLVVLPLTINHERIAEQELLAHDCASFKNHAINVSSLLWWLLKCVRGKIALGRVHISAGSPLLLTDELSRDYMTIARDIQHRQQEKIIVSNYHITCGAAVLGLDVGVVSRAMEILGCHHWHQSDSKVQPLEFPTDQSELWSVFLHCSHVLGPLVAPYRPQWANWFCRSSIHTVEEDVRRNECVVRVAQAIVRKMDAADSGIELSLEKLKAKGFDRPIGQHVLQVAETIMPETPRLLLNAALSLLQLEEPKRIDDNLIMENAPLAGRRLKSEERLGFWGYADSLFVVDVDNAGAPTVSMKGGRYRDPADKMKGLVGFVETELGVKIDPMVEAFKTCESRSKPPTTKSMLTTNDLMTLKQVAAIYSVEDTERIRHGTGHSIDDVFQIRNGELLRSPDVVVWPETENEVEGVIKLAARKNWCIIPFGGGTNVSHATRCPSLRVEPRPIVSLDLTLLDKVLWVDHENMLAHVQAGIRGGDLVRQLGRQGYTIGHEPDSIEFSTLGGWISTKASGMKRSKYGNIEDIVQGISVVTPQGRLSHGDINQSVWGRSATGLDLGSLALGSEGCLGVITSAVIRLWKLPDIQEYEGILLADFLAGLDFVRDVALLGAAKPSSCRLLDNEHFRMGIALRSDPRSMGQTVSALVGKLFFQQSHFRPETCVCVTITYEGSREQVLAEKHAIHTLVKKRGGLRMGRDSGKNGYDLTFLIAYLRDFALSFHVMGESFETFAPWSKVHLIVESVKGRVRREHANSCLPGKPFVGCRVTQLYNEGACLYFYFCMTCDQVPDPIKAFSGIETSARREILDHGGSLSHHHGVGKIRASFLPSLNSSTFREVQKKIKEGVDPLNVFGARNGVYADASVLRQIHADP